VINKQFREIFYKNNENTHISAIIFYFNKIIKVLNMDASSQSDVTISGDAVSRKIENTVEIVDQMSEYGSLITNSLYLIIFGMMAVFITHKLVSKFIYPMLSNLPLMTRLIKVILGTFYVLILAIAMLIVFRELGFDVKVIGQITLLSIIAGAVLIFFLVPFIPKLPFILGNLVEINGIVGIVSGISSFHTTIKKFDGTLVYIPNALVMASKILNYHQVAERRIEMEVMVSVQSNIQESIDIFIKIMEGDERILDHPAPPSVFAVNADSTGIKLTGYCWANNDDWLATRSALWIKLVETFVQTDSIKMARPQNEVYIMEQK